MSTLATKLPEPLEPPIKRDTPRRRRGIARFVASTVAKPDVRNGAFSLIDQGVVSAASFATSVIIGRLCSKEELGVFYLALTIVYLARGIQEQLISAPYVIYCHRHREGAQALYAGSSLLHQLMLSGACMVALLGMLGLLLCGFGPAGLAPAVAVLLGALPFLLLREFVRRLAVAHLQMSAAIVIDVSVALLQIGGLAALAYFHELTIARAYLVMGVACATACGGWFFAKRLPVQFKWSRAMDDWRDNWGFARWAMASHLIGFAAPYLMPWILTMAHNSAQAGVLAACINLVGVSTMFITGLSSYLTPRAALAFSRGGAAELRHVLRTAAAIYAAVLGVFAVFVLATGDFLLVLAYGNKYEGYGAVMGIYAVSAVVLSMNVTLGNGLWAIDRPKANLRADVCGLVVAVGIVLCLVHPLGVLAAALGDLGGKVTVVLIRYFTLRRLLKTVGPFGDIG